MELITLLLLWTAGLLIVGSYTDIRWREVPDWLNFAALAAAIGTRVIYGLATGEWTQFLAGLAGFLGAVAIALAMYYLGQWGGGDSKMLMALGVLLGVELSFNSLGVAFFINTLIAGAVYGLAWSIGLALVHWHKFRMELSRLMGKTPVLWSLRGSFIAMAIILLATFFLPLELRLSIALFGVSIPVIVAIGIMIKAVETGCMIRRVPPSVLTEGDWIVKDVVVDGKRITGPADLGVSIPQIRKLVALAKEHKIKTVILKEGIPFVPSFLLGFIITLVAGNLLLYIIP